MQTQNEEVTLIYETTPKNLQLSLKKEIKDEESDSELHTDSSEEVKDKPNIESSQDDNSFPSLSKQYQGIMDMPDKLAPRSRTMTEKGKEFKESLRNNKVCSVSFGESADIPMTYNQVKSVESHKWIEAINKEWNAMLNNTVFEIVPKL